MIPIFAYSTLSTGYLRSFNVREPTSKTSPPQYLSSLSFVQKEGPNRAAASTTAFSIEQNLTLQEIFEKTEKSVVQVTARASGAPDLALVQGLSMIPMNT